VLRTGQKLQFGGTLEYRYAAPDTLPPSGCHPVQIGPTLYQLCGSDWYQPQYYGPTVQYVVVKPPR